MGYEMIDDIVIAEFQAEFHHNIIVAMLINGKLSEVDFYIEKAKIFVAGSDNIKHNSRAEYAIGLAYLHKAEFSKGLILFKKLDEIYQDSQDYDFQAKVKINLGLCYHNFTHYDSALKSFFDSLRISEKADFSGYIYDAHINIGNTYSRIKDRNKAIHHYKRALKIAKMSKNDEKLSTCYINIGTHYFGEKNYVECLEYFKKSLELSVRTNRKANIVKCNINIGRTYYELKDIANAKIYYKNGLKLAEKSNYTELIAAVCSNYATMYKKDGDTENADVMFKRTISRYQHLDVNYEQSEMLGEYADFLAEQRKYKRAFEFLKDKAVIDGIISMDNQTKTIADLNIKYEIETKEKEADLISEQNTELQIESKEREKVIKELEEALSNTKVLSGLVPICSHCKNIRDDKGFWNQIESYISEHNDAIFSHGICPSCMKTHYPNVHTTSV